MESWQKYANGWEIKEWNASTFDVNQTLWTKQSYEIGGWALGFLVDYIKPWATYTYGGVYVDADYLLTRPLDELLDCHAFVGKENTGKKVGTAIYASEKCHWLSKYIMEWYGKREFFKDAGARFNWNSIYIYARLFKELGLNVENYQQDNEMLSEDSEIAEGIMDYAHQKLYNNGLYVPESEDGYGVHLNVGSWGNENWGKG